MLEFLGGTGGNAYRGRILLIGLNSHRSAATASPETILPYTLQFMRLLWAVAHGLDRTSKMMARQIGVTGPQRLVLRVVSLIPGTSAGSLARLLHVHPSTLTGVLQRLVEQRLLVRTSHHSDRRRAVLRLTPKGERINSTARATVEAAVTRALGRISKGDQAACRRVLQEIASELDARPDETTPGRARRRHLGRSKKRRTATAR